MTGSPPTPPRVVSCPQCQRPVEWVPASRWRPFCSDRCRMLDLGAWATESYRIPVAAPDPDEAEALDDLERARQARDRGPD